MNLMKKKLNKKGFTLAELLIVIAIIAVLAAIAIPVFSSALSKAKAGTDLANLRAAYAAAQLDLLTNTYADEAAAKVGAKAAIDNALGASFTAQYGTGGFEVTGATQVGGATSKNWQISIEQITLGGKTYSELKTASGQS